MTALAELMGALAGVPLLEGASCKGRPEVFDVHADSDPELIERAQHICRSCPALAACRAWVAATPPRLRPSGVVGGELIEPGAKRSTWKVAS